mmetsp:Transcript_5125/g.14442  ORF Transcript_5125/g.14442 Transcript_5125/m.14442 type:complete len:467 (-) Transcript_5125:154-1554(-)
MLHTGTKGLDNAVLKAAAAPDVLKPSLGLRQHSSVTGPPVDTAATDTTTPRHGNGSEDTESDTESTRDTESAAVDSWPNHETAEDGCQYDILWRVRRQIERYFSDANLCTDHFLHGIISEALPGGGWVSCSRLMRYKKIRAFRVSQKLIAAALRGSFLDTKIVCWCNPSGQAEHGEKIKGCLFVRRRQPYPPLLRKECRGLLGDNVAANLEESVLKDPHGTLHRLKDQLRVREQLRLEEIGDGTTVFYERHRMARGSTIGAEGSHGVERSTGAKIAVGYERVLYGDGGPYIECTEDQVCWDAWPHYHDKRGFSYSYYDEYYTLASYACWCARWERWEPCLSDGVLMLYAQRHTVDDRPWAPGAASQPHAWREYGYADYRPGFFYFAADGALISTNRNEEVPPPAAFEVEAAKRGAEAPQPESDRRPHEGGAAGDPSDNDRKYQVCWDFEMGRCARGDRCKWQHALQ